LGDTKTETSSIASNLIYYLFIFEGSGFVMATQLTTQPAVVGFSWPTAADLSKKDVQQRLTPAATRGLLKIAKAWELSTDDERQLLGGISTGSFYNLT